MIEKHVDIKEIYKLSDAKTNNKGRTVQEANEQWLVINILLQRLNIM
jgi:hypothetical protein